MKVSRQRFMTAGLWAWRAILAGAVLIAIVLVNRASAKEEPQDIRAKSLSLVDERGRVWLFAGVRNGLPNSLTMYDTEGRVWLFAGYSSDKSPPAIQLLSPERGFLKLIASDERVGAFLHDKEWQLRAAVYTVDDQPRVLVEQGEGKGAVMMQMADDVTAPYLMVVGPKGETLLRVPTK